MKSGLKKSKLITLLCISVFSLAVAACNGGSTSSAGTPTPDEDDTKRSGYLGWIFGGAHLPLWVYKGSTLVAYIDSSNQNAWLGEYKNATSDGTYEYLYQDSSSSTGYTGCNVQVKNGRFVTTNTGAQWCKGVVASFDSINGQTGNENTIQFANASSDLFPMMPPVTASLTAPTYASRTLTINNNTQTNLTLYFTASCSTNGSATTQPLNAESTYEWMVPSQGVISCNITVQALQPPAGAYSYNTLFEITAPGINELNVFTNVDVSMVNGFNMSYSLYPKLPTDTFSAQLGYFQRDTSPNKPTPQSIFLFNKENPASRFKPTGLQTICDSINTAMPPSVFSATTITTTSGGFEVWQNLESQTFVGCYSPLTITANFLSPANQNVKDEYNCAGAYNTYQTCTVAESSPYVQLIHSDPNTKNAYAYPYDDSYADFSIDRHTSLVWDIDDFAN
ncbi:thaumatin family protein [Aquella oligotrophica]|uniref:Ig-like domain-containing protein n=1 Tax=Aquella oligotrophica TaxID=2067065 RepID=A0A2I7N7U7_9NEIS|nr:thaumatin family protein [Aquella oligotrophica]AUR52534.1 hypothetical protein CUN60_09565 [Aquella oligotrophica]